MDESVKKDRDPKALFASRKKKKNQKYSNVPLGINTMNNKSGQSESFKKTVKDMY